MTTTKRIIRRPQAVEESRMQGYFMISRRDAAIAITNKLTGSQCRLWLYLMIFDPFADYTSGGEIKYHDLPSVAEIAVAIGSSADTVEKDLRKLRKLRLYEYRTVTVQGHNLTAAKAKAEAEHLSKSKSQGNSRKSNKGKSSAYLSPDEDYLSPDKDYLSPDEDYLSPDEDYLSPDKDYLSSPRSPQPLPNKGCNAPQINQNYSNFIKTLSKEERANFLNFCESKTKNLSQEVIDIEAWLAHTNKAGKNRWEVYYEKYLAAKQTQAKKTENKSALDEFRRELEEIERQAQKAWSEAQNQNCTDCGGET